MHRATPPPRGSSRVSVTARLIARVCHRAPRVSVTAHRAFLSPLIVRFCRRSSCVSVAAHRAFLSPLIVRVCRRAPRVSVSAAPEVWPLVSALRGYEQHCAHISTRPVPIYCIAPACVSAHRASPARSVRPPTTPAPHVRITRLLTALHPARSPRVTPPAHRASPLTARLRARSPRVSARHRTSPLPRISAHRPEASYSVVRLRSGPPLSLSPLRCATLLRPGSGLRGGR